MTQPKPKHSNPLPSLRESLAAVQHEIWSHWMQYLLSKCDLYPDGAVSVPFNIMHRWVRQMHTEYRNLPEQEKESDRHQADKILAILDELDEK